LKAPDNIPVYLQASGWQFQGFYGQVALPESMPTIAFSGAYDQAVATQVGGSGNAVAVPELAILSMLPFNQKLKASLDPMLQHATARGATGLLRMLGLPAVQRGIYIDLPHASMEVSQWCSGFGNVKWLLALGIGLIVLGRRRTPWSLALLILAAAPLIAIEANVLRVAGIGATLELAGLEAQHAAKVWLGWAALALGVGQIVGLGWLARPASSQTPWPRNN
jgi:exosortase